MPDEAVRPDPSTRIPPDDRYVEAMRDPAYTDRFWQKVDKTDKCWNWIGTTNKGYGQVFIAKRRLLAHRLSLCLHSGIIPDRSIKALHSCENKKCVNPDHLRWGSQRDNLIDSVNQGSHAFSSKRLCKNGHPFSECNTHSFIRKENGRLRRVCRRCQADATARYRARREG